LKDIKEMAQSMIDMGQKMLAMQGGDESPREEKKEHEGKDKGMGPSKALIIASLKRKMG
jgi:hypothetical protein